MLCLFEFVHESFVQQVSAKTLLLLCVQHSLGPVKNFYQQDACPACHCHIQRCSLWYATGHTTVSEQRCCCALLVPLLGIVSERARAAANALFIHDRLCTESTVTALHLG